MEDLIYKLFNFLPIQISDPITLDYLDHQSDSIVKCIGNDLYSSAYNHLHLIYMTFIYIQLLRISQHKAETFKYSWIGFGEEEKGFNKNPTSPFSFSLVNEKKIFRFFRILDIDQSIISQVSDCVKIRNENLHAKGLVDFLDDEFFTQIFEKYLNNMEKIINAQVNFLGNLFGQASNKEIFKDIEYELTRDDIEINVLIPYMFSKFEVKLLTEKSKQMKNILSRKLLELYGL